MAEATRLARHVAEIRAAGREALEAVQAARDAERELDPAARSAASVRYSGAKERLLRAVEAMERDGLGRRLESLALRDGAGG